MHDRTRQAGIDVRTPLEQIGGRRRIMMQGGPTIENLTLPGMLERDQAVASNAEGKYVDPLVG